MSQNAQDRVVWHLKKGSEKKFRFGHPWVFSSELAQSPKSVEAGGLVELRDYSGAFLGLGYGHPNSLISFRTLSLTNLESLGEEFFVARLKAASLARHRVDLTSYSHRLIFAEGDYLPGLIVDRFAIANSETKQAFAIQSSTAGMERLLPVFLKALETWVIDEAAQGRSPSWDETAVVVANDSKSRAMEGLEAQPKRIEKSSPGFDGSAQIILQPVLEGLKPAIFDVDFIGGQKTGFFLDQRLNVQLAAPVVHDLALEAAKAGRTLKILDLFCYVGQWGAQLAQVATNAGAKVEVTLVDASQKALELAARNVERHGGIAVVQKSDVLEELARFDKEAFDVVICDPPAFVKKKKDLPTGGPAYYKTNREALRKTRAGGLYISCSCSGLFDESEFRLMLAKVMASAGTRRVRWIARGSHSADHPQRPEFPQGTYLKSWLGIVE